MPLYLVERILPEAGLETLDAIRRAADDTCLMLSAQGTPIHYRRGVFTPGDSRCRCLFEADNADLVREANDLAQLPYSRIVLAVDM